LEIQGPHFHPQADSQAQRENQSQSKLTICKLKRAQKTIPEDEQNSNFKQVTDPKLDAFKIPIPDAEVYYIPQLIDIDIRNQWYTDLANLSTWYKPTLKVYGKSVIQSHEIAAHTPDLEFEYKCSPVGQNNDHLPFSVHHSH